jgi:hypothetical protein
MRLLLAALASLLLAAPVAALARGGGRPSGAAFKEIEAQMRLAYERTHPCPASGQISGFCPGYVIYYLPPSRRLASAGPWQFQWMTLEEESASRTEWIAERGRAP